MTQTTTEDALYTMHQAARKEGLALAYRRTALQARATDPRRQLADSAEKEALLRLILDGYTVHRTLTRAARYDLLIEYRLRAEVKASTWSPTKRNRGRYACNYHNKADVLLWLCANAGQWFVIPCHVLNGRSCLAIWSYDPTQYTGQWRPYLNAWGHIADLLLSHTRPIPYQPGLL